MQVIDKSKYRTVSVFFLRSSGVIYATKIHNLNPGLAVMRPEQVSENLLDKYNFCLTFNKEDRLRLRVQVVLIRYVLEILTWVISDFEFRYIIDNLAEHFLRWSQVHSKEFQVQKPDHLSTLPVGLCPERISL